MSVPTEVFGKGLPDHVPDEDENDAQLVRETSGKARFAEDAPAEETATPKMRKTAMPKGALLGGDNFSDDSENCLPDEGEQ